MRQRKEITVMTGFPRTTRRSASLTWAALAVAAALAGCASLPGGYDPGPLKAGDSEQAVLTRMGAPTERQTGVPGVAQRLVYARGPMGKHTFMIDLDAQGRVTGWFNALEPQRLRQIVRGARQEDLRRRYGPPAEVRRLAFEGRSLWAWRFPTYDCEWFVATFDAEGRVLDAGVMTDPRCDIDHD
jgi:hypothetical protein